jgi:mannose-6-phosphate isomerase-like protein (cupin superfamily)
VTTREPGPLSAAEPFDINGVKERLAAGAGGYEVVHRSPGLEIGVSVVVAPAADRPPPVEDDKVYVVIEGSGVLEIEGRNVELHEGHAVFVPAGVDHHLVAYEQLSLLVIFEKSGRR